MDARCRMFERLMWCAGVLLCGFLATGLIVPRELRAAPLDDLPVTVKQPDGEVLHLLASGDEFHNWLHDADHYTIMQDPVTGYYVYAVAGADGDVAPSQYPVGKVKPAAVGLKQGVNRSPQKIREKAFSPEDSAPKGSPRHPKLINKAPQTGTINNLVIFIRFNDSPDFTHSIDYYTTMFNSKTAGDNSMYNFYQEASYKKLVIDTSFYPIPSGSTILSYQDSHSRAYFQPYHAVTNPDGYENQVVRRMREHALLKDAVSAVGSQVPASLNIDGDNDGRVDNVCFIIQGEPTGWSSLLWPHMWSLYSYEVTINSKKVYTYNFQLETSMDNKGVGVLAHEMFHSLGAPDLYHYYSNKNVSPAAQWDLMNSNLNPPQHMTGYMKMYYGKWIASIESLTESGRYTLKPITSPDNNAYRISSPNSTNEYFVVEYRKKTGGFESSLPNEGLLVYRVNTDLSGRGNASADYAKGVYDELYIYRPDGTTKANGTPADATFSGESGRTEINDTTDPSSFLGDGSAGGLKISNVGPAGDTISFDVEITSAGQADLEPYKPGNWSDKIVVSKRMGSNQDSDMLLTSDTLYVDCAVINETSVAITEPFRISLYVDGKPAWVWSVSSLGGYTHAAWEDLSVGPLGAGEHKIKLVADTLNTVAEASEKDNAYVKTVTIVEAGLPNLVPYKPSGWSAKIVVSEVPGTHTDTALDSSDTLYVDWAVKNRGTGDVAEPFTVILAVDGVKTQTWIRSEGLPAGGVCTVDDFAIEPLAEGLHQIKILIDKGNSVEEGKDSDNQYRRVIEVVK